MDLYFAGAEQPSWRNMLAEQGVETVALSYMGLRRKVKFARPWLIADKFDLDKQRVFLDSGAFTLNKAESEERYSTRELKDIAAHYMSFVTQNIDSVEFVSEFDALPLGRDWIREMRKDFWDDLPDGKFMPIWHAEWGVEELDSLCQRYNRVGIPQTGLHGRNLTPVLNNYVRQYGVKLHGVAMTKPEAMAEVAWDSVASTSWISPSQYGDTIVWTEKELKRYPKKMKDAGRKRHRTLFEANGFDSEAIENDDTKELLRLSIWSFQQLASSLDAGVPQAVVTPSDVQVAGENVEPGSEVVVTPTPEVRKSMTTPAPVVRRPTVGLLPGMALSKSVETVMDEDGTQRQVEIPLVNIRSESQRMCNTCFLSAKCPAFVPNNNCAFEIPVEVKSKDQMAALQNGLIEMQAQRVLFSRFVEEQEGGYPDPNLSGEMDRLQKMIKVKTELEADSFSVKFEAKGSSPGGMGMLSRLFGREAGEQAKALPSGPIPADDVIQQMDVIDVEVVSDEGRK